MSVAARSFNKVMEKCPHCGTEGPKELVSGPKRVSIFKMVLWGTFTGGLGLLIPSLYRKSYLEAFCPSCNKSFSPKNA